MRIGIAGTGRTATEYAHSVAALSPGVSLVVHDSSAVAAGELAAAVGGTTAASPDALLAGCDALVVAGPAGARRGTLSAAIDADLPVLCEKPLGAEAAWIAARAERRGARVQVGFQRRTDPEYRQVRYLIRSGSLGRLLLLRTTAFDRRPVGGDLFAGGLLGDIDTVRWLAGRDPVTVSAVAGPDLATAVLSWADGLSAVLTAARFHPLDDDHRLEALGTGDSVSVGLSRWTPLRLLPSGHGPEPGRPPRRDLADRFAEACREEVRIFLGSLTGPWNPPADAGDAARAHQIAAAAAESARTHRPVRIPESEPAGVFVPVGAALEKC